MDTPPGLYGRSAVLLADDNMSANMLTQLQVLGVSIALDDFGAAKEHPGRPIDERNAKTTKPSAHVMIGLNAISKEKRIVNHGKKLSANNVNFQMRMI